MTDRDDGAPAKSPGSARGISAPPTVPRPSTRPPPAGEGAIAHGAAVIPPERKSRRSALADGAEPPGDEDFDAEKTMVVDPDDAPTADYDPRVQAYDPRARGAFTPIPAAPASLTMDAAGNPQVKTPEGSRRRGSRRTVRVTTDDGAKKKDDVQVDIIEARPMDQAPTPTDEQSPDPSLQTRADDFGDEVTVQTAVVKPLRIIDVGSTPPPPIRSAEASWPPPAFADKNSEAWTPVAPLDPLPQISEKPPSTVEEEPPTVQPTSEEPPTRQEGAGANKQAAAMADGGPTVEVSERVSEITGDDLEEIEPDAAAIPQRPPPKKPPPPPPKGQSGPAPKRHDSQDLGTTRKVKPWFEDIFCDEYVRTHDRQDADTIRKEVDFIEESLGVEKHGVVLDLGSGFGDHAHDLAARGYSVVGLDLSQDMLNIADKSSKARLKGNPSQNLPKFERADMRELAYEEAFDGAYCWSTSFGYFDEEKNLAVLAGVHRALRQGGMFLIDVVNRDYVAPRSPSLVWFEGTQCVCMDDMFVDFFSSRLRVKRTAMFEGGVSRELEYSIRLYSLHELGKMLHDVGFKVVEVTGHPVHPGVYFGTESPRMIVLAERV